MPQLRIRSALREGWRLPVRLGRGIFALRDADEWTDETVF